MAHTKAVTSRTIHMGEYIDLYCPNPECEHGGEQIGSLYWARDPENPRGIVTTHPGHCPSCNTKGQDYWRYIVAKYPHGGELPEITMRCKNKACTEHGVPVQRRMHPQLRLTRLPDNIIWDDKRGHCATCNRPMFTEEEWERHGYSETR